MPDALRLRAANGVRTVAPAAPGFCRPGFEPLEAREARENKLRDVLNLRRLAEGGSTNFKPAHDLGDLTFAARFACSFPRDAHQQAWLAAYRQLLVNETDMPDTALDALLGYALTASDRRAELRCAGYAQDTTMPAPERAARSAVGMFVCGNRGVQADEMLYWLDRAEALPDELLRAALVWNVASWDRAPYARPLGSAGIAPDDLLRDQELAGWVQVRHDGLALDPRAFEQALSASRLDETERVFARVQFFRTKRLAQLHDTAFRALGARVPELLPMVTTLGEAAFTEWTRAHTENRAAMEQAFEFELRLAQGGPGAVRGCAPELRRAWHDYLEGQRPASPEDVEASVDTPAGSVLAAAYYRCELEAGERAHAVALAQLLQPAQTQRGPRVAALNAVRRAAAVAVRDNPRFPYTARGLRPFALMRDGVSWVRDVGDYSSSVVEGVVATLTPRGEDVRVTFRTQRVELPVLQCTETNRIHRILPDGTIQYRRNCVQTGTRLVDVTPPAGLVHRDFAAGIAVGHALRAYQGSSNEDVRTVPLVAYADGGATRPAAYLGVTLR
ncbi:MAG: hypothetical protein R3B40_24760 [Polyangiales bacterium]|nr:hypothetical protein [Myxococcales bacterium]